MFICCWLLSFAGEPKPLVGRDGIFARWASHSFCHIFYPNIFVIFSIRSFCHNVYPNIFVIFSFRSFCHNFHPNIFVKFSFQSCCHIFLSNLFLHNVDDGSSGFPSSPIDFRLCNTSLATGWFEQMQTKNKNKHKHLTIDKCMRENQTQKVPFQIFLSANLTPNYPYSTF